MADEDNTAQEAAASKGEGTSAKIIEAKTKAHEVKKARAMKGVGNLVIITILFTVIGIVLSMFGMNNVFMFVAVGALPAITANIIDHRPGRGASKTVSAFNLAGMVPYLAAIIASGMPNPAAVSILQNPYTWFVIYGSAAFGWGVVYLVPHIVQLYLEIRASYMVKKLSWFQAKLIEEWGDGVKK